MEGLSVEHRKQATGYLVEEAGVVHIDSIDQTMLSRLNGETSCLLDADYATNRGNKTLNATRVILRDVKFFFSKAVTKFTSFVRAKSSISRIFIIYCTVGHSDFDSRAFTELTSKYADGNELLQSSRSPIHPANGELFSGTTETASTFV